MSPLAESPLFSTSRSPLRSSQSSSEAYILSLVNLPSYYAASLSAPSNVIDVFDKSTLQRVDTFQAHATATTSLRVVENLGGFLGRTLVSSGKDGCVKFWDLRSKSHGIKINNARSLLSCDVSPDGLTVAAGTDLQHEEALILYWDPRNPGSLLRTHGSTHSDDVTTLSFAPPESGMPHNALLSASSDGLISTSNADEDDEDEAVFHVGNWGCSVSQASWILASPTPKIWAASDMETFSTWTHELDQCQSLDIRNPALHEQTIWVTDYLISCAANSTTSPNLGVFVGSNEGDIALLSNTDLSNPAAAWYLHKIWSTGHVGIVRSLLWDEQSNVLLTGGEDSKINVWSNVADAMDVDPPSRKRSLDQDDEQAGKRTRR